MTSRVSSMRTRHRCTGFPATPWLLKSVTRAGLRQAYSLNSGRDPTEAGEHVRFSPVSATHWMITRTRPSTRPPLGVLATPPPRRPGSEPLLRHQEFVWQPHIELLDQLVAYPARGLNGVGGRSGEERHEVGSNLDWGNLGHRQREPSSSS